MVALVQKPTLQQQVARVSQLRAQAQASAPAPVAPVATQVKVAGVQVSAARNVVKRAATLGTLGSGVQAQVLRAGKPCKVRVPYTVECWARVSQALASAAGNQAPASALAAVSTGDFVNYAVRSGWLVPVKSQA